MNPSRTRRVRLLTGSAAGALALGALAMVPAPATAAAVPDQTRATSVAAASVSEARVASAPVAKQFRRATKTTRVSTGLQLRRAVLAANKRRGVDRIVLTDNMLLAKGRGGGNGPLRGDIDVNGDLIVIGSGFNINMRRNDRIFDVAPGSRFDIKNVTLRNGAPAAGQSGGAVRGRNATVIVRNSAAFNNNVTGDGASGGAFFNDGGVLRVIKSNVSRNEAVRAGGAIEADGGVTNVFKTDFRANGTGPGPGNGGAIHLTGEGTVSVSKSSALGNFASLEGGAFWNSSEGDFTISGTTMEDNEATGAGADNGGGAVYNDGGRMIVENSDLVDNTATGAAGSGGAILNNLGDLTVETSRMIGNSATRAGGAIEANEGSTEVLESVMRANDTGAAPGNGGALHLTGAGEVLVSGGRVVDNTASLEGGGLWNSASGTMEVAQVKLSGNTAAGAAADNGGGGLYNDGGNLLVRGSDLDANDATGEAGSGGGILNNGGLLTVVNTSIDGGDAPRAGGGIEAVAGTTTITRSSFSENSAGPAPGNGGAVHLTGAGTVVVAASSFGANEAVEGGALWNSATGTMTIARSEIIGNEASGAAADQGGGGVYNDGGSVSIVNTEIRDNIADGAAGSGGGVLNNQGTLDVTSSSLRNNESTRAGGAIEANAGTTTVSDTVMDSNFTGASPGNGGGLHLTGAGSVAVSDSTITNNVASAEGGGLWNSGAGTMTVEDSTIRGNSAAGNDATQGGGGLFQEAGTGTLTVTDSVVTGNSATGTSGSGGGVLNDQANLVLVRVLFSGNDAVRAGGGIETNAGTVTLTDVDLDGNTTGANPGNGGGFHAGGVNTVIYTGGTVSNNTAANEGGGLWCSNSGVFTATGITFDNNTAPDGADVYHQDPAAPPVPSTCSINGDLIAQGTGTP